MSLSVKDVYWVAGLLEGEGSFGMTKPGKGAVPMIQLQMTDRDIVARYHAMVGSPRAIIRRDNRGGPRKPSYASYIQGRRAAGIMMTIWPLMGERRQQRIREVLADWRSRAALVPMHVERVRCNDCGALHKRDKWNWHMCRRCQSRRHRTYMHARKASRAEQAGQRRLPC